MSKVFKMNDYDWVYAENEEQAKQYYVRLTECLYEELEEVREVSLSDTMYYEISKLSIEEQNNIKETGWFAGEPCVLKSFEWVVKQENIKAPCIIATTEA